MSPSPVVVIATFEAAEGRLDDLRQALVEAIPAVHAEPGCQLYAIHDADDSRIYMIEKWDSQADLDRHAQGEAVQELRALVAGKTTNPAPLILLSPIPAGTAEQGQL
ncbi:putative quinol monooxygenase [Microlunatus panaciterrae]|uniref:Quinol monooxygenase YgiN n=1 Tax=Microlunatus panaciterrae TaxID=400768 RepID=A0ABS2REL4_9ACTN|nr:putative quinol monooxygenase [Microlunatus panaciterrae]MBM7797118.1 quinol monooxygenase YgiN [Microlunatus panaciterrae]